MIKMLTCMQPQNYNLNRKEIKMVTKREQTQSLIDYFKKTDIFSPLTDDDLYVFASRSDFVDYEKGEIIFKKGEKSRQLFIITHGEVIITNNITSGEALPFSIIPVYSEKPANIITAGNIPRGKITIEIVIISIPCKSADGITGPSNRT